MSKTGTNNEWITAEEAQQRYNISKSVWKKHYLPQLTHDRRPAEKEYEYVWDFELPGGMERYWERLRESQDCSGGWSPMARYNARLERGSSEDEDIWGLHEWRSTPYVFDGGLSPRSRRLVTKTPAMYRRSAVMDITRWRRSEPGVLRGNGGQPRGSNGRFVKQDT